MGQLPNNAAVILLVEDNPDDELLTRRALQGIAEPVRVHTARDGVEALRYLEQQASPPCLILLDLKLPKMNGLELLRRLREHPAYAHLPVVMLSSSKERRDVVESYRLGANSYVQKPIGFEEFTETVHLLGRYWITKNLTPE